VTGWDDGERPGPGFAPGSGRPRASADILEQGSDRRLTLAGRWPLIALVLAAAGLLAGLAGGYAAGDRHARDMAASLSGVAGYPTAPAAGALPLIQAGSQCSAQIGRLLQLGVEVTNQSAAAVTLRRLRAVLPLGGLRVTAQAWGPCGELPGRGFGPAGVLPAGASTWFTVTFKVLENCPLQYPVQFTVDYQRFGRTATVRLPGFADLSHVPYQTCPVASP
jgi:hypothetical protein